MRDAILAGLGLFQPTIEFLFGLLAGVAILLLEQADELIGLATRPVQVIVGEFAPPLSDLTSHFLPFAFEYVPVHPVTLMCPSNLECSKLLFQPLDLSPSGTWKIALPSIRSIAEGHRPVISANARFFVT